MVGNASLNKILLLSPVLPKGQPRISGMRRSYRLGEKVKVNCTSERSKPAAALHWYINGELVS